MAIDMKEFLLSENNIVDCWNALPNNVVEAQSLNSLKARIDKHWTWKRWCNSGV